MKMTEPYNLGLLALISAAGEISYEELKSNDTSRLSSPA